MFPFTILKARVCSSLCRLIYRLSSNKRDENVTPIMLRTQARSGSTYLMQLLANFPDIVATKQHPYEIRIAQYYAACYQTLSGSSDHDNSSRPNFFHRDQGVQWIGTNPFNNLAKNSVKNIGAPHYQLWSKNEYNPSLKKFFTQTIENYYQSEARYQGKSAPRFFCEKSFYINRGADVQDANVMHLLSKDCVDIYLVRDPLDILVSQIAFFRKNEEITLAAMKNIVKNLAKHMNKMVTDYMSNSSTHIIYYEMLINDPTSALLSLSQYLQLDYDEKQLCRIVEQVANETEKKHITSKSSTASIKRWQKELSPEIICFAEKEMKEYIKTFNYSY